MNVFKRAITNIKRQPVKNGLLLVIIFILGTVLSAAISVRTAMITTEENVMMRVPAVSAIHLDHIMAAFESGTSPWDRSIWRENRPTAYDITTVGQLPYVRAYDFYLNIELLSREFEWVVPQLDESRLRGMSLDDLGQALNNMRYFAYNAAESFPVRGVSNPDITDIEAGLLTLTSGRTFHAEEIENGAMLAVVSQLFADYNNLYIGATLRLHSAIHDLDAFGEAGIVIFPVGWLDERFMVHHEILEFEIIGIFNVEHQLNYENYQGRNLFNPVRELSSLYNRIYIPVTVADVVSRAAIEAEIELCSEIPEDETWRHIDCPGDAEEPQLEAIFLMYDPRDLGTFTEAATELLPDFWEVRDVSSAFYSIIASMDSMLEIANLILLLAAGATIITLTLTITILLRDRRHEIGIYMALGDRKSKILSQFLTEIGLIAVVGIALSLFAGNMLSHGISRNMFEQTLLERAAEPRLEVQMPWELMLFNPAEIPLGEVMEMYDTSLDVETIISFIGVSFTVILIATIAPIMQIVKLEPKKILL